MAEQDTVMAETEPEMVTISVYVHLVARGFDVSEGFVEVPSCCPRPHKNHAA